MDRIVTEYSFGDSDLAVERLALVAHAFEAPSRAFLAAHARSGCALAVDLGCGPGHSTRLLREVSKSERTVGLEASSSFLRAARRDSGSGLEFLQHDATELPFPTGPAELIYARLLVSHLSEPAAAIRGFASQLRPGGRLLLDEVESIRSESGTLQRYLQLVEEMLARRGQCLYVGPRLETLAEGLRVSSSQVTEHEVDRRAAATMFSLNLRQLRDNADVREHVPERELDALAAELFALRAEGGPPVVWGLHQLVIGA